MARLQVLCTLLACVTIYITGGSCYEDALGFFLCLPYRCDPKKEDCFNPPESCRYGSYLHNCTKRIECAQGPGDSCGVASNLSEYKQCETGLTCDQYCRVCRGCHQDTTDGMYKCYDLYPGCQGVFKWSLDGINFYKY